MAKKDENPNETVPIRVYRKDHALLTKKIRHNYTMADVIHDALIKAGLARGKTKKEKEGIR